MYFQKIFNIVFKEEQPVLKIKPTNNKTEKTKPIINQKKIQNSAYCLFANSGQSFLAMYNDKKINIILNDIEHPDKYDPKSKEANEFINNNIKKKKVFLNVIETLENGDIIAEVYLDENKSESLNMMLKDLGLDKKSDIKDENKLKEVGIQKPENTDKPTLNVKKKNQEVIIGYLKDYGPAPYLNKPGNKNSYFITIETEDETITKWGLDFERAIKSSGVVKEDYLKINKDGTSSISSSDRKLNLWNIEKLEDAHTIASKLDGPPINYDDQPVYEEDGYQGPMDWSNENIDLSDVHTNTNPDVEHEIQNMNTPPENIEPNLNWEPDWDNIPDDSNMPPEPPPEEGYSSSKKMSP